MNKRTLAIARATGVIGATVAIITGITMAQLTSTASLTDYQIASATANLQVWDGNAFAATGPGVHVTGLVPGQGTPFFPFYFKNAGDAPLTITVKVPNAPTASGFTGWENLKVTFHNEAGGPDVVTDMAALLANQVALPGNPLPAGAQGVIGASNNPGNYDVSFDIAPGSVTPGASSVTVGSFDFVFTGTVVGS